jgi:hypothetical protein
MVSKECQSQAGFLAEFRTVKCKQRRVRSAVGHPGIHVGISVWVDKKRLLKFGMTRIDYVDSEHLDLQVNLIDARERKYIKMKMKAA